MPFSPCPRGSLLEQQLRRWSLGGSRLLDAQTASNAILTAVPVSHALQLGAQPRIIPIKSFRESQPLRVSSPSAPVPKPFFAKRRVAVRSAAPPASPDPQLLGARRLTSPRIAIRPSLQSKALSHPLRSTSSHSLTLPRLLRQALWQAVRSILFQMK